MMSKATEINLSKKIHKNLGNFENVELFVSIKYSLDDRDNIQEVFLNGYKELDDALHAQGAE